MLGFVAAALVIAGLVVGGVRTHGLASTNDRLDHSLSSFDLGAVTAARGYAIQFATYQYADLDADFAATEAHSVDPFLSQYRSETAQLQATLVKAKASSSATIVSAGLVSITSTSAVVDLFLNQTITNDKGSHVDAQRVEMTLVRRDSHWLISNVVLP
jgi:Mce-associated membrane protein